MKVKVKMKGFQLRKLSKAQILAFEMTAEALKTEILQDQVTPKQTGALEESLHIATALLNKGKLDLLYDMPYGKRLYYHPEYNFRQDKNVNAKGLWLEDYTVGEKKSFAPRAYKTFYRALTKGVLR